MKKLLCLVALMVYASSMFAIDWSLPDAINIAKDATVTSSTEIQTDLEKITNGDLGDAWNGEKVAADYKQWFCVAFTEEKSIGYISVLWTRCHSIDFDVYVTNNAPETETVSGVTNYNSKITDGWISQNEGSKINVVTAPSEVDVANDLNDLNLKGQYITIICNENNGWAKDYGLEIKEICVASPIEDADKVAFIKMGSQASVFDVPVEFVPYSLNKIGNVLATDLETATLECISDNKDKITIDGHNVTASEMGEYTIKAEYTDLSVNETFTCEAKLTVGYNWSNNIVQNGKAKAYASHSGAEAYKSIDNNLEVRWIGANSENVANTWWYVDLGNVYNLDIIDIVWEGAYSKEYAVYVATDWDSTTGEPAWNTEPLYTQNKELAGFPYDDFHMLSTPVDAKFVKIQQITPGTTHPMSFWEFRAHGTLKTDMPVTVLAPVGVASTGAGYVGFTYTAPELGDYTFDTIIVKNKQSGEVMTSELDKETSRIKVSGLTAETTYTFNFIAVMKNADGNAIYSIPVDAQVATAAYTGPKLTVTGEAKDITWSDATISYTASVTEDNAVVDGYTYSVTLKDKDGNVIGESTTATGGFVVSGLNQLTQYTYTLEVTATAESGELTKSELVEFTTVENTLPYAEVVNDYGDHVIWETSANLYVYLYPRNIAVEDLKTVTDESGNETIAPGMATLYVNGKEVATKNLPYVANDSRYHDVFSLSGLVPSTTYEIKTIAWFQTKDGQTYQCEETGKTLTTHAATKPYVLNLTATDIKPNEATLTWDIMMPEGYVFDYVNIVNNYDAQHKVENLTANTYTFTGLKDYTQYTFKVIAFGHLESDEVDKTNSEETLVTFTTLRGPLTDLTKEIEGYHGQFANEIYTTFVNGNTNRYPLILNYAVSENDVEGSEEKTLTFDIFLSSDGVYTGRVDAQLGIEGKNGVRNFEETTKPNNYTYTTTETFMPGEEVQFYFYLPYIYLDQSSFGNIATATVTYVVSGTEANTQVSVAEYSIPRVEISDMTETSVTLNYVVTVPESLKSTETAKNVAQVYLRQTLDGVTSEDVYAGELNLENEYTHGSAPISGLEPATGYQYEVVIKIGDQAIVSAPVVVMTENPEDAKRIVSGKILRHSDDTMHADKGMTINNAHWQTLNPSHSGTEEDGNYAQSYWAPEFDYEIETTSRMEIRVTAYLPTIPTGGYFYLNTPAADGNGYEHLATLSVVNDGEWKEIEAPTVSNGSEAAPRRVASIEKSGQIVMSGVTTRSFTKDELVPLVFHMAYAESGDSYTAAINFHVNDAGYQTPTETMTDIQEVEIAEEETVKIYTIGGNIIAPEGAEVYTLNGMRVATEGLEKGIYVVRIGNKAVKVLIR